MIEQLNKCSMPTSEAARPAKPESATPAETSMKPLKPPRAPLRRQTDYLLPHDSRWSRIKLSVVRFLMRRFGVPHDATDMIRSAMKLGNPTKTEWPAETLPMNSRLFASRLLVHLASRRMAAPRVCNSSRRCGCVEAWKSAGKAPAARRAVRRR